MDGLAISFTEADFCQISFLFFFIPFTKAARETVSVKTLINHDIRSEAVAKPSRLMVFARLHKDFCSSAPREAT